MSRLPVHHVFPSPEAASGALASDIGGLVSRRASEGRPAVLGLATGSTPIRLYAELVRLHRQGLSFSNVITFNLDEYLGIGREHPESYWKFMHSHLFEHIDISRENIHIPDGSIPADSLADYCDSYERKIVASGGIDLQVLGIGRNGHIGFNEPGAVANLPTHVTELNPVTIRDAGVWPCSRSAMQRPKSYSARLPRESPRKFLQLICNYMEIQHTSSTKKPQHTSTEEPAALSQVFSPYPHR